MLCADDTLAYKTSDTVKEMGLLKLAIASKE